MQCAIAPEVTRSRWRRTWGLKLVRGISTSHYLVASGHLTHPSLGELQSTTHQEHKPQSRDVASTMFHVELQQLNINLKQTE